MRYKLVTNENFERYINYTSKRNRRKFEDRWDTLDLDDIVANIEIPSEGEIDAAVRELDLFDDAAIKSGANDVKVGSDGKLDLDFDDDGQAVRLRGSDKARVMDFDDKGKTVRSNGDDDKVREVDLDDKGKEVDDRKSNLGSIGKLDYDDDIDTSKIAANIEDVYTTLESDDVRNVKAMIKRYAGDIKDTNKIKKAMLAQAVKLNYECLRALCGDMKVQLSKKEKDLGFINRDEINDALVKFKEIASKLDGSNNTYGLIPNAIVSCKPEDQDQIKCNNIIDFLRTYLNLPVHPMFLRGAITNKLYSVADQLADIIPNEEIDNAFMSGRKGFFARMKDHTDIPSSLLKKIFDKYMSNYNAKQIESKMYANILNTALNNKYNSIVKDLNDKIDFTSSKGEFVIRELKKLNKKHADLIKKKFKIEE